MSKLLQAQKELYKRANKEKGVLLQRYFKTGKGEYSEGDVFLGINVPDLRVMAKDYIGMTLSETLSLLKSKFHEERLLALFILVDQFNRADEKGRKKIYTAYLMLASKYVNNWDLVDSSASYIVGKYLENKPRDILYKLARSKNLWEKRISIISTHYFIRKDDFADTMKIALMLMKDEHDLIHKAVGWMLREMGKRSEKALTVFLNKHAHVMPRTMLRYAIEKYPEPIRKKYLSLKK